LSAIANWHFTTCQKSHYLMTQKLPIRMVQSIMLRFSSCTC
jgi:hypothetical protein